MILRSFILSCLVLTFSVLTGLAHAQNLPDKNRDPDRILPPEAYEIENIPDEYIDEADQFHATCSRTHRMTQYYNCDCLAMRYLDKRIENGDETNSSGIMMELEGECIDTTEVAGTMLGNCLGNLSLIPIKTDPEEYCKCVANEYAKVFEQRKLEPNSLTFMRVQNFVMSACASSTAPR